MLKLEGLDWNASVQSQELQHCLVQSLNLNNLTAKFCKL